jgi:hypothetical protein
MFMGPTFSDMPNSMTIRRAISVALRRSSPAPVVANLKTISSALRPPSKIAIMSRNSGSLIR